MTVLPQTGQQHRTQMNCVTTPATTFNPDDGVTTPATTSNPDDGVTTPTTTTNPDDGVTTPATISNPDDGVTTTITTSKSDHCVTTPTTILNSKINVFYQHQSTISKIKSLVLPQPTTISKISAVCVTKHHQLYIEISAVLLLSTNPTSIESPQQQHRRTYTSYPNTSKLYNKIIKMIKTKHFCRSH
ncbi:integumentary mucin C.1-like [Ruditapes philippinarum]|uniref:integumentary mucin C.1-like n=1 Tax=Ruditapes philippinarum TaxID=129788 RepID=UPI00295BB8C0|nr:integumentary mucin C.1-like [Ruditapes philippinarum]